MGHSTRRLRGLHILLLALARAKTAAGWNIALHVTSQVGGAVGGESFAVQPAVAVTDKKGEPQLAFVGSMTVQAQALPSGGREPVWKEGEAAPAADALVSQDVVGGQVEFAGLGIDVAGEAYRLEFVLYDEHGLVMGTTLGDVFAVAVGTRFRLGLVRPPATAYGGAPFAGQPVLAVQDRGGNVVADVNEGTVRSWDRRVAIALPDTISNHCHRRLR